eukprot:3686135-Rhodomonas_salina.1
MESETLVLCMLRSGVRGTRQVSMTVGERVGMMTWVMSSDGGAVSLGQRTTWGGLHRRAGQRTAHLQAWGCLGTRLGAGSETR